MSEVRAYQQTKTVTPEVRQKLHLSRQETSVLTLREIKCSYCGYLIERVFSDISGHKMVYCKKCKEEYPVNLGYFRRMKVWRYDCHPKRERQKR